MLRPRRAVVQRAASGQAAQASPKRATVPVAMGRSGAVTPAGQVTVAASTSMLKSALEK